MLLWGNFFVESEKSPQGEELFAIFKYWIWQKKHKWFEMKVIILWIYSYLYHSTLTSGNPSTWHRKITSWPGLIFSLVSGVDSCTSALSRIPGTMQDEIQIQNPPYLYHENHWIFRFNRILLLPWERFPRNNVSRGTMKGDAFGFEIAQRKGNSNLCNPPPPPPKSILCISTPRVGIYTTGGLHPLRLRGRGLKIYNLCLVFGKRRGRVERQVLCFVVQLEIEGNRERRGRNK